MPREKSVGAVIFRKEDNKIYYLLLHYHSGHWEFARGHGEKGEDEQKTARREIEEETGLKDLKIIPGFREYSKFFFRRTYNLPEAEKKKAPWIFKLVVLYLAETKTKDIKISKEHKGYAWLLYDDAFKKLTKNAKGVLEKANDFIISKKSI
ncbi:MAG: NUDIX domain-containing protein [Candidatus Staskawiczbacteria bacterium]|jgi:8-oxo-dGTP pyrophosphatase MutT (NUDIX family)